MPNIILHKMNLGCDPEFFITRNGEVIGSEKAIDQEKGLMSPGLFSGKAVVDGVQVELNPAPQPCRANLVNGMITIMRTLNAELTKKGMSASFETSVKLSKEELESLSMKARMFGCAPSLSTDKATKSVATVKNQEKIKMRCAGGHIHIGNHQTYDPDTMSALKQTVYDKSLIMLLDLLLGNTCVMLDRDEGNKIRRKMYGRAGEYRLPKHGIEYRTLSNFWLRSPTLALFVFGLTRQVVSIWMSDYWYGTKHVQEFLSMIDMKNVQKAINKNHFPLAQENWNIVKKKFYSLYERTMGDHQGNSECVLSAEREKLFDHFIKKGIDHFWPNDTSVMSRWTTCVEAHKIGWRFFCDKELKASLEAE